MKRFFTLLAVGTALLFSSNISAQGWGYAGYGHWMADVREAADGSIWSAGYGSDAVDTMGISTDYIVKLNSDGTLDWKGSSGISYGSYREITSVLPAAGGGAVILAGYNGEGPIVYKVDDDGDIVWTNESWYNTVGFYYYYGGQIAQLADGRLIIVGLSEDYYYHFIEVSEDGDLLSTSSLYSYPSGFFPSYFNLMESGIVATDDGGFAFSAGNDAERTLYKYNSGLGLVWNESYAHDAGIWEYNEMWLDALSKTDDGGYLLAGSSMDNTTGIYKGTLRKISATGSLEWLNYIYHGGTTEEGTQALQLDADNYIAWTQDAGDNSSNGWVLDATGSEVSANFIPLINCTGGWGEIGMEIWHASKSADGGYLLAGRQYLEDCQQRYTILKSDASGNFPDCIFNCVWPGDANNDAYVTSDDLLEIGINYGATGFTRADGGIDWSGKLSRAWADDTLYWYVLNDLKWTDCNGDGTINDDDTTAVINNFSLDHPINSTLKTSGGDIPLYLKPTTDMLHTGLNEIPLYMGDAINSVDEIYGLRFTIHVEGEDIDAASLKINYTNSWFTNDDNRLPLSIADADNKNVYSGVVRMNRENTGGNGQIGTLGIVVIDNISGKTTSSEVTISFSDVKAIKVNREEVILAPESLTYGVEEGTAVQDITDNAVQLYPTLVANNSFTVSGTVELTEIEIADLAGRTVMEEFMQDTKEALIHTGDLAAGQYMVTVHTVAGSTVKQIIIQ